jgi:hypothetical protein
LILDSGASKQKVRMNRQSLLRTVVLTAVVSASLGAVAWAQLGSVLKGGAIAFVVDRFAPQINNGINSLTGNRHLQVGLATKVVPILSVGSGSYLGAVQVAGTQARIDQVKAVAQLEGEFNAVGDIRLRALVPITSRSVSNLKRVPGVGVSALVDIKL